MFRNFYTVSSAVCAPGSYTRYRLLPATLLLLVLCVVGINNARASLPVTAARFQHSPVTGIDLRAISYRAHQLASLQQQAAQAIEDDAPYLAVRLWQQLAGAGDSHAAFRLGLYYDASDVQRRDPHRAVYWYRQAAMAGDLQAQHNLAVAYANGDGVTMDIAQAIKWWTRAARRGNPDSEYNLGIMYAAGKYGIKPDIEQAKHWWRKAAMHGDAMAQYNLGTLFVNNGVHDYCEATHWWKEAAKNGVQQASLALRVIKSRDDYQGCQ